MLRSQLTDASTKLKWRTYDEEHRQWKRFQKVMDDAGDDPTALQPLLDEGLSVNTSSMTNMNLVEYAAYKGFPRCIEFLIGIGGDALSRDDMNQNALCKAGQYARVHGPAALEMIEKLTGTRLDEEYWCDETYFPHPGGGLKPRKGKKLKEYRDELAKRLGTMSMDVDVSM